MYGQSKILNLSKSFGKLLNHVTNNIIIVKIIKSFNLIV